MGIVSISKQNGHWIRINTMVIDNKVVLSAQGIVLRLDVALQLHREVEKHGVKAVRDARKCRAALFAEKGNDQEADKLEKEAAYVEWKLAGGSILPAEKTLLLFGLAHQLSQEVKRHGVQAVRDARKCRAAILAHQGNPIKANQLDEEAAYVEQTFARA